MNPNPNPHLHCDFFLDPHPHFFDADPQHYPEATPHRQNEKEDTGFCKANKNWTTQQSHLLGQEHF
jgi:hypothetical protein